MRKSKVVMGLFALLLVSTLAFAFRVQTVKTSAGTIYIRADGSIDPPTANITSVDSVTYTFTDNNYGEIVVERDNIVVNGAGFTLQGPGGEDWYSLEGKGIDLTGRINVTVKNTEISSFFEGILLSSSSNNTISGNDIANNGVGIRLRWSSNNPISGNTVTNNSGGAIFLHWSSNNPISGNTVANNGDGIGLEESSHNTISGNDITNHRPGGYGIAFFYSSNYNTISGNNIAGNRYGIHLTESSNNIIYHNNIVDNTGQVDIETLGYANFWDDGYPTGGNYWSDHVCTGDPSDGSQPYVIDAENIDHYPFQNPRDMTPPVAEAGIDQTVTVDKTVSFDAGGSSDNVGIVSYEWDFGDGTTGTGETTTHTYSEAGSYTVTLTVTDGGENIATDSLMITVQEEPGFPWMTVGVGAAIGAIVVIAAVLVIRKRS